MVADRKPGPRLNAINRPFFEACNRDAFLLQRCLAADCGRFVYFPRVCCPYCGGGDLVWQEASGRGRIRTFTVVHRPQHPAFLPEAPYLFAAIALEEGPLMYARVEGAPDPTADLIGQSVEAVFVPFDETQKLPHFRLAPR